VSPQPTGEQTDTSPGLAKVTRTPTVETTDLNHESSPVSTQMEVPGQTVLGSAKIIIPAIGVISSLVLGFILIKILGLVIALWYFVIKTPEQND
jgi:hypothetical protein